MKNRKRVFLSLIICALAIATCLCGVINPVQADSLDVIFNFNLKGIVEYLPSDLQGLKYYITGCNEGETITLDPDSDTLDKLNGIKEYYNLAWLVDNVEVDIESYVITKDVTFVAKWTPKVFHIYYSYQVSEDEMSEITGGKNSVAYTIESGRIDHPNPSRANYHFAGWYSDINYSLNSYSPYREAGKKGNVYLYAKWVPIEYTINYNTDAENVLNPSVYTTQGADIVLSAPVKEGHIFKGWYLDSKFTKPCSVIKSGSTGNISLYPKWELEKYIVTYIMPDGETEIIECQYGKTAEMPKVKKSIFEVVKLSESRENITGDTTIEIEYVNIWYVYLIILLVIAGVTTTIVIIVRKRNKQLSRLRYMYQTNMKKGHRK